MNTDHLSPIEKNLPVYEGPIFDGDTHLYETEDAYKYIPDKYKPEWDFTWKVGQDGQFAQYLGERKIEVSAGYTTEDGRIPPPGRMHEWLRAMKEGKNDLDMRVPKTPDMQHPEARLKKMDEFGVEGCLMYGSDMVGAFSYLDQLEPAKAVLHAYNQWMLEHWQFTYKERIYQAPIVILDDIDWACKEAEWAIKNGARLLLMPMGSVNNKAPAHPDFDRFWSILNEAHCRVVYHVSEALYMSDHMRVWGEVMQSSRLKQTAFMWMHGYGERPVVETLSSYILWNFFERFPNIKIVSAENGSEWAPNMLIKMDKCRGMAKNGFWPGGQLKERPSAIFKRHISVVAYPEDNIKHVVETSGSADWILTGSDYPHSEGVPEPIDFIKEGCRGLSADHVRKIMYDNGKKFITN